MIIIHRGGGRKAISCIKLWTKIGIGKPLVLLLACVISVMFIVTGCGGSDGGGQSTKSGEKAQSGEADVKGDPFASIASAEIADTETGFSEMSRLIKELKQAVEADQTEEAKKLAEQMAGIWNAIKGEIEAFNASKHQLLQEDLGQLIEETKASKWNKELLIQLDYKLYQSFRDMKQELLG
ncbi:hypothetical protein [Paenibacillus sp. PL91]|uniref:hypothetical protein n=1 Tax=Paenibacillus sp. PL91 TaxID=2729538 RepID=UPI00145D4A59|nr:hypothetical protein [Paenibacillus sp. PL91]MBC9200249.1 hypothetical protein [Paenibacillus sp. PL91]